jgi:hypothetical protein
MDRREFPRAVQLREHQRISTIRLLSLPLWPRSARRRHHHAVDLQLLQPSIHYVTRLPRFIHHVQRHTFATEFIQDFLFASLPAAQAPARLTLRFAFGLRHLRTACSVQRM